jgi:two-component system sensor histidine kinase KdpD
VLASFLSVGLLDFFFVLPRMSFAVSDVQYLMTFGVMLAVGLIIGQLTAGLRYQAEVANERERRARRLFELTRELAGSLQMEQVLQLAEHSLGNEVQGVALVYFLDTQDQLQPSLRQAALPSAEQPDLGTARWALDQGEPAGMFTDTLPGSAWLYLPLKAPMRTRGVLALRPGSTRSVMLPELREQLETYARIIGQSLERVHYIDVAQAAVVGIESERLRNSLLSALSHDLRTPLAVVYGLADTLAALPNLPAPARDMTTALRQEAQRINAMVTNLLDMARLQSGTVHLRRQWLPVDEVVGSALQAMQGALSHHPVYTQVPAALPLVHIDAVLIERVLCNLLENAVKYTPPDSTITVAASVRGTDLLLCVSDNGPGLPPGSAELLFEKFTRGERESSIPGVGLGLAICRAIMAAHQGRIWAERAPQGGAAFYLSLPLGTPPSLPAPEDDAEIEDATARPAPVPASNP